LCFLFFLSLSVIVLVHGQGQGQTRTRRTRSTRARALWCTALRAPRAPAPACPVPSAGVASAGQKEQGASALARTTSLSVQRARPGSGERHGECKESVGEWLRGPHLVARACEQHDVPPGRGLVHRGRLLRRPRAVEALLRLLCASCLAACAALARKEENLSKAGR
jgi:hypothetical protein